MSHLSNFLRAIWHNPPDDLSDSLFTLSKRAPGLSWHLPAQDFIDNIDADEFAVWVSDFNEYDDIWFNVAFRDAAKVAQRGKFSLDCDGFFESKVRGNRRELSFLPSFTIDWDIGDEGHAAEAGSLPADRVEVDAIIEAAGLPVPTIIVHSGHGYQDHWVFHTPIDFSVDSVNTILQRFRSFQQKAIDAALNEFDVHVDKTAGPERQWRLPGTQNRKISDYPKPVLLVEANGENYSIDELVPRQRRSKKQVQLEKNLISEARSSNDGVIRARASLVKIKPDHDLYAKVHLLLNGESVAGAGARNETLQQLVSYVVFISRHSRHGDEEELATALFGPSLLQWSKEPDATKTLEEEIEIVADMFERARSDYEDRQDENRQAKQEIENAEIERSGVTPSVRTDGVTAIPRLVQYKNDFFAYSYHDSKYLKRMFVNSELLQTLRQEWTTGMQADLYTLTQKGDEREKKPMELVREFGVSAVEVRKTVVSQESYFDDDKRIFYDAIAPYDDRIEPIYSPFIDKMIDVIGGKQAELLRDWLAGLFDLDTPCAALYLQGPPRCGKSLLAKGAASLWGKRPTDFEKFSNEKGFSYLESPLIHIEEGVSNTKGITSRIRRLVTEQNSFMMEHKGQDPFLLEGTIRLIVTANNPDAITEHGVVHTQADADAIIERIAHILVPNSAVKWLDDKNELHKNEQKLRGEKAIGLSGVIESGEFANHAAWLHLNRDLSYQRLYCSPEELTDFHLRLLTQGTGGDSDIMEWAARFATDPTLLYQRATGSRMPDADATVIGDGYLLLRSQDILDFWRVYMNDTRKPQSKIVTTALSKIGNRQGDDKNPHYEIDLKYLQAYVRDHQIGNWQTILKNLNA